MGKLPCADDEVWNAVSIDVSHPRAMQFGERDPPGILRLVVIHDHVPDKRDIAIGRPFLLEPGQPETMGFKRGDYVIQSITVHVVDGHRCPARDNPPPASEFLRMVLPQLVAAA